MKRAIATMVVAVMVLCGAGFEVQARPSATGAVTLGDQGWSDSSVGRWDAGSRTGTLTCDPCNLPQGIAITANDIVLDGNGRTLSGGGPGYGVYLNNRQRVTVRYLTVEGFDYGIFLQYAHGNTLESNTVRGNALHGIYLMYSGNNTVRDNTASGNGYDGISLASANGTGLEDNTATGNGQHGICISASSDDVLAGNTMSGNRYNFRLDASSDAEYRHTIGSSNLADGLPIYYVSGAGSGTYGGAAGAVYLINCSGVTLKDLTVDGSYVGVLLWQTSGSRLDNVRVNGSSTGIWLRNSSGNVLDGNTIEEAAYAGLHLEHGSGNTLQGNTLRKSGSYGLYLDEAIDSVVYGNHFDGNPTQAQAIGGSNNDFDQPKPVGGNYWSDWTTPDKDGDGFVDDAYDRDGVYDALPRVGSQQPDSTPPTTTLTLNGTQGGGGWYSSEVRASLDALDNEGGSGVKGVEYGLNGAAWEAYTGPLLLGAEGTTALRYRSSDRQGNVEDEQRRDILIDRTPPAITIAAPQPDAIVEPGIALSFDAVDNLSGLASLAGTLSDSAGSRPVASGDVVSEPGLYALTVSAADAAGNTATATSRFAAGATGGSLTGGGWIGAGDAGDRAYFTLTCRQRDAALPPTGEANLRAAGLNLKAQSFRWLVVDGDRAWCEGEATAGGAERYGLAIAVVDGKAGGAPDLVRLRIWEQASGLVIYDNQPDAGDWAAPSAGLDGGNITIHKG